MKRAERLQLEENNVPAHLVGIFRCWARSPMATARARKRATLSEAFAEWCESHAAEVDAKLAQAYDESDATLAASYFDADAAAWLDSLELAPAWADIDPADDLPLEYFEPPTLPPEPCAPPLSLPVAPVSCTGRILWCACSACDASRRERTATCGARWMTECRCRLCCSARAACSERAA